MLRKKLDRLAQRISNATLQWSNIEPVSQCAGGLFMLCCFTNELTATGDNTTVTLSLLPVAPEARKLLTPIVVRDRTPVTAVPT